MAMKVTIKKLPVTMELKNKEMEIDVYEIDKKNNKKNHLGDLVISKGYITWCPGKHGHKSRDSKRLSWKKFINHMMNCNKL
jgi:hypothetical protein